MAALRENAPRHAHVDRQGLELLERLLAVGGDQLAQAVAAGVAGREHAHAERLEGAGLLQPLEGLRGPPRNGRFARRTCLVAHASPAPLRVFFPPAAPPRTSRRIASSTPLTNAGESASPKRFASSTASSSTTAAGVSGSANSS